jgi:hypothetical protein
MHLICFITVSFSFPFFLKLNTGMSDEHIKLFRKCSLDVSTKRTSESRTSESRAPVLEIDVFVTRPGPLGVRLRYHRLITTPYIALWEDSNHPNPGPLLSAILKLDKQSIFVPVRETRF